MAQALMTPGVYIEEKNAFPGSVVEVATAVPAFIGYTEKAERSGKSLSNQAIRITSFKEYVELFGEGFNPIFTLNPVGGQAAATPPTEEEEEQPAATTEKPEHTIKLDQERAIEYVTDNHLYLFPCIKLFFSNGGGACYIVSVGTYEDEASKKIEMTELVSGIDPLLKVQEPTMIVIPDAVGLSTPQDCYDVYKKVLAHCKHTQSRVAVMDIFKGYQERIQSPPEGDIINIFREKIGSEFLNYGAVYYPWLDTNIVQESEVDFRNLDASVDLKTILTEKEALNLIDNFPKDDDAFKAALAKDKPEIADDTAKIDELLPAYKKTQERNFHLGLVATSPKYKDLLKQIREVMNLLPPAAAMAGIYTSVDTNRGVWKAPANVSLNNVIKPSANITHDEQKNLNVDAISGKSVNAIRTFPGIGTLVWGGRTLDGNSLDWRYINVRRTMIMLEQSIKLALRAYVFEPNDANTWVTVKSMVVNFLTEKWKQGALAGASPEDAFEVQIGLGSTMTSLDILEGRMLMTVKLAIVRPAEFIVVTFEQQMQKS